MLTTLAMPVMPGPNDASVNAMALLEGFVRLSNVGHSTIEDMRHATNRNFTWAKFIGYLAGVCIVATPVARACSRVKEALKLNGLTPVIYGCYRPAKAA